MLSLDNPRQRLGNIVEQVSYKALCVASVDHDATVVGICNTRALPHAHEMRRTHGPSPTGTCAPATTSHRLDGRCGVRTLGRLVTGGARDTAAIVVYCHNQTERPSAGLRPVLCQARQQRAVLGCRARRVHEGGDFVLEPDDRLVSVSGRTRSPLVLNDALESGHGQGLMVAVCDVSRAPRAVVRRGEGRLRWPLANTTGYMCCYLEIASTPGPSREHVGLAALALP